MDGWLAEAQYEDGTEVRRIFPYLANDNYATECKEQAKYEEWLLTYHEGCTWYSVVYVEDAELWK